MKRAISRDLSPAIPKRSRSSMNRYGGDSSEDEVEGRRGASPIGRRYPDADPRPPTYKVLCVSNLHHKASDEMVRDALFREFKRFGDVSVKVPVDADPRVAYVYFRTFEEARDAKHSKTRILFFDLPVYVEPVYETSGRDYSPHPRSRSPIDYASREPGYARHSPMMGEIDDRYDARFDRGRPPYPRDYYMEGPMMRPDDYAYGRAYRGRPYGQYGPPMHRGMGGFRPGFGPGGGRPMMDGKRDKFPNYLHHVAPEDDPLATRTLFAGNLELNIGEEELRRIFSRYGIVDDIDVKRPPPGTGNAYAFVRYQNLDMAHRAKIELSGQYIGKFQCKIGYGKVMPTSRVWVGGLGPWVNFSQLTQEFDRFGAIKKIDYEKGDVQAYILYESLDAAQAAVKEMRGFELGGADKKLKTDFAEVATSSGFGSGSGSASDFPRDDYAGGRGGYEDYGDFGGYSRGRGRGRGGWHDRGRGGHRGGYHGDYSRGSDFYEAAHPEENTNGADEGSSLSTAHTLADVARKTPSTWEGSLILKNSAFGTKLHVLEGSTEIAELLLDESNKPSLRITQRLRLDQSRLDDVQRRISAPSNATILLSLPNTAAPSPEESSVQTRPLRNLVAYLKQKEAAGVITLSKSGANSGNNSVLYAFPPCTFSLDLLRRAAPNLTEETTRDDHLVIVVVRAVEGSAV